MAAKKLLLADLLVARGLADSRLRAQSIITAGEVLVDGSVLLEPERKIAEDAQLELNPGVQWVGRGALKLKHALENMNIHVAGKICADVGSSTGGFTQVLLAEGAQRVYAIDTAYGELAWKLRSDERVVVMERVNILSVESFPEPIQVFTIDVSLLSATKVLPVVSRFLEAQGDIVLLLKPQYEATPQELPSGAVITDPDLHQTILARFFAWAEEYSFIPQTYLPAPITGMGGNQEYLVHLKVVESRNR